jgi:hypothetical protein
MREWAVPAATARGFVLSVLGDPEALASIYGAWSLAEQAGEGLGRAILILLRRRAIDLPREVPLGLCEGAIAALKDARRVNDGSMSAIAGPAEVDDDSPHGDPERAIKTLDEDGLARVPRPQVGSHPARFRSG